MTEQAKKSPPSLILLAWLVVSIPAAWGVYNTVLGSVRLFTDTATSPPTVPISPPAK